MLKYILRKKDSYLNSPSKKGTIPPIKAQKTFFLSCPHCQFSQEVLFHGISTFCKKCQKVINIEKVLQPQAIQEQGKQALKTAYCSYCKNKQLIPSKALSSFCKKCGKRINLQNYKIKGKFNGTLETQGSLHVTPTGQLKSNITCHSAVIEGKVNGRIQALDRVELRQTAVMNGSIETANLIVQEGATFVGIGKITPSSG